MAEQLADTLKINMPSLPITERQMAGIADEKLTPTSTKDMFAGMQERRTAGAGLREQALQAEADILKGEQQQKIAGLEKKQLSLKTEAEELAAMPERQTLKQAQEGLKNAAFIPSKENAEEIATFFSLMGIVGMAIGGGGKQNAYAAMAGMNGMLDGYQKGRADIYKRERDMFDKNFKALQTKVQIARDELADAVALKTKNFEAGRVAEELAIAKTGSPVLEAKYRKQGALASLEMLKELNSDMSNLEQRKDKLYKEAEERKIREREIEQKILDRQEQRNLRLAQTTKPQYQLVEQDGKVVAIDLRNPTAPPVETGLQPGAKKFGVVGQGGAANSRYAFNIHEAGMQATNDLLNITQQPADTVLGTFAGMTGQSGNTLISSLKNTFARKITPEDQRLMQQMISGLEYNMARVLGGGYANSSAKAVLDIYKQQVAQQGDSPAAQAMFLARMKQELKTVFKAFKNHPGSNAGYVADFQEASDALDKRIPFQVADVTNAIRGTRQTFVEKYVPTIEGSPRFVLPTAGTQTSGGGGGWSEDKEKRLRELQEKKAAREAGR